jgi:4'-phosphopantetheinyl transferase
MLAAGEVHVWSVHLDATDEYIRHVEPSLSADERQRAGSFRFHRHRARFVARRAALRALLADYLRVTVKDVTFIYGPNGKPALAPGYGDQRLSFNLSHSAHLAVIAVALDRAIGIDVEIIKPVVDFDAIASRFFTARENIALHAVPPAERLQAFFNCWTRKEAVVKASGEGLSRPLDSFEVSLAPDEPARLLAWTEIDQQPEWSLQAFTPEAGFVAAVAAPGSDWSLRCEQWSQS